MQSFVQDIDDAGLSLLLSIEDEDEDNTDFFPRRQVALSTMKNSELGGSLITSNKTQFVFYCINNFLLDAVFQTGKLTGCWIHRKRLRIEMLFYQECFRVWFV